MSHSRWHLNMFFYISILGLQHLKLSAFQDFIFKTLSYILWQNANIGTDIIIIQLGVNIYFARSANYFIHRNIKSNKKIPQKLTSLYCIPEMQANESKIESQILVRVMFESLS